MFKNTRTKRAFSLSVDGLEDRRLCTAGLAGINASPAILSLEATEIAAHLNAPTRTVTPTVTVIRTSPTTSVVMLPSTPALPTGDFTTVHIYDPPPPHESEVDIILGDIMGQYGDTPMDQPDYQKIIETMMPEADE